MHIVKHVLRSLRWLTVTLTWWAWLKLSLQPQTRDTASWLYPMFTDSGAVVLYTDPRRQALTWVEWKRVLKWDWTSEYKYRLEDQDCDDYAIQVYTHVREALRINTLGYVHNSATKHAWIVLATLDQGLVHVEPQTDSQVDAVGKYTLNGAVILI